MTPINAEPTPRSAHARTRNRLLWLASTAPVLVVFGACATAAARPETITSPLLSADTLLEVRRQCQLLPAPREIPQPEQVLDLAAARAALAGTAQAAGAYAVLEAHFDSTGARDEVLIVESNLEADVATELVRAVSARVAPTLEQDVEGWGVLIRADAGNDAEPFTIGRMEYCSGEIYLGFDPLLRESSFPGLQGPVSVVLSVRTDDLGVVRDARVVPSTGSSDFDQRLIMRVYSGLVIPPLINRRPAAGWTSRSLTYRFCDGSTAPRFSSRAGRCR